MRTATVPLSKEGSSFRFTLPQVWSNLLKEDDEISEKCNE